MKGELYIPQAITSNDILKIITGYDIYRHYVGNFHPNRIMSNPFRKDLNPSFLVGTKSGEWKHFDFADERWCGGPFDLVEQIYSCNYDEALRIVDRDFGLGIIKGAKIKKSEKVEWEQPEEKIVKAPFFQIITRKFNNEELEYWNQYHQDVSDLKRENVFAPSKIYRNRILISEKRSLLTFCYFEETTNSWKIYRPAGRMGLDVPVNERKWDSAIPFNIIEGLKNINNCEYSIVATSKKDSMVIKKALSMNCCCHIQGENPHAFTRDNLDYIDKNSQVKIIAGDNDKTGKEFSYWLTREHRYKHINPPDGILQKNGNKFIKDFGEWGRDFGLQTIYNHFKNKQLCQ